MKGRPAGVRWAVPLLVVLAAALVALAGSALAGLPSRASVSAADPAEGTWLGPQSGRNVEHTVRAASFPCFDSPSRTCSGFEMVNVAGYKGTVNSVNPGTNPPSLSFSPIISNYGNDRDDTCPIPAGTVIARFVFVRALKDNYPQGARGYQGQLLRGTGDGRTCTLTGLGGTYYFSVNSAYDSAGKPGAFFGMRIVDAAGGSLWNSAGNIVSGGNREFTRKTGTYTAPTTTTTTPTTTTPYEGGDGDNEAPAVKALASKGKPGRIAQLRYSLDDDSGFAKDEVWVYKGKTKKVIWRWKNDDFDEVDGDVVFARWKVPATLRGIQKFCVRAADEDGAQSAWSCSTVKIS